MLYLFNFRISSKLQEISATRFLKDDEVAQLKKSFQAIEQQKALFDRLTITASSDSASPVLRSNFDALLKGKTNVEATVSDAMALIKKYKFLTLDLNDKDIQESYTTFLSKNTLFLTDDDALSSYIDKALNGDSQFHLMLDYQFAQTLAYRQKILNDRFIQIYGEDVADNLSLEQAGRIIHDSYTRNSDMGEKYDIAVQNGLIRDLRTYRERVEAAFEKVTFRDAMTFYKNLVQRVKANGTPLDSFVLYDVEMALKSKLRDMEIELKKPIQDKDFQTTYGSYKTLIDDINYLQDRRLEEDPFDSLRIADLLSNLATKLKANEKQSELRTNQ